MKGLRAHLLGLSAAILGGSSALAQVGDPALYCAYYFEARAAWMEALDGNPDTVDLMRRYARIVWANTPLDCGMHTGLRDRLCDFGPTHP